MVHVLMTVVLLQQAPRIDEKKVQELVEKCGSEEIADREAATAELFAMGEAVLPHLEKAMGSARGEIKARLEKVAADLTLPARWAKDLLEGDWNQAYQKLDQALRTKELDKATAARVISAVILSDSAMPDQRQNVLSLAERYRVRDIWPALLKLIEREDSPYDNYSHYLQRLRPPKEAAATLLKLIPKLENMNANYQLLELARSLKPEPAALEACFTEILEGDDANLKANALNMIHQGRVAVSLKTLLKWWRDHPTVRAYPLREAVLKTPPGDGVAEMAEMLKSSQSEDAGLAIEYIGRQKVVTAAAALAGALEERPEMKPAIFQAFRTLRCEEELRKWISGSPGPGRRPAISLATELGWTAAGPEIARCFADSDAAVRREAAVAAGALRIADAAPKLESLLKDADGGVRRAALVALATLQRKDATRTVLAHLRSDDADLQAAAVEALPLVDAEQALAVLTSDEALGRPITRHALAALIVKGGTPMLHRVMARVGSKVTADDLHAQIRLIQSVSGR